MERCTGREHLETRCYRKSRSAECAVPTLLPSQHLFCEAPLLRLTTVVCFLYRQAAVCLSLTRPIALLTLPTGCPSQLHTSAVDQNNSVNPEFPWIKASGPQIDDFIDGPIRYVNSLGSSRKYRGTGSLPARIKRRTEIRGLPNSSTSTQSSSPPFRLAVAYPRKVACLAPSLTI